MEETPVCLAGAGGTGLNLTAADYVIHMDPWWKTRRMGRAGGVSCHPERAARFCFGLMATYGYRPYGTYVNSY